MDEIKTYKNFAKHLSDISGEVIKKYFRSKIKIESKKDLSPVTVADKKAEEVMREAIIKEFPQHGIIGEEFGEHNVSAEYKWVLDPIDGTRSFISGALSFGTLIALMKNNNPVIGVINHPVLDEFLIGDNEVTEINGETTRMRDCKYLTEAVLLTTDHLNIEKYQDKEKFDNLIHKVKIYRQWGDCYGYYLLATGFADIMIDPVMSVWDKLALVPIIKGAGGIITDYHGDDPIKGNSIIAANSIIHRDVIDVLN
ncbi:histidinol-phosphatase [bacterium BMS3Abin03]|nr:histidinol-phosphatase [bacterium BMS3Abin03]